MLIIEKHKIREFLPVNFSSATKKMIKIIQMKHLCLIKHRAGSDVLRRKGLLSFFTFGAGWKRVDRCKPLHLYNYYPLDRRLCGPYILSIRSGEEKNFRICRELVLDSLALQPIT